MWRLFGYSHIINPTDDTAKAKGQQEWLKILKVLILTTGTHFQKYASPTLGTKHLTQLWAQYILPSWGEASTGVAYGEVST